MNNGSIFDSNLFVDEKIAVSTRYDAKTFATLNQEEVADLLASFYYNRAGLINDRIARRDPDELKRVYIVSVQQPIMGIVRSIIVRAEYGTNVDGNTDSSTFEISYNDNELNVYHLYDREEYEND